jgi:hypothetical protein
LLGRRELRLVSDDVGRGSGETDGGELAGKMGPYGILTAVGCTPEGLLAAPGVGSMIMLGEGVAREESSTSRDGCRVEAVPSTVG